jgi:hypothetical protein
MSETTTNNMLNGKLLSEFKYRKKSIEYCQEFVQYLMKIRWCGDDQHAFLEGQFKKLI